VRILPAPEQARLNISYRLADKWVLVAAGFSLRRTGKTPVPPEKLSMAHKSAATGFSAR